MCNFVRLNEKIVNPYEKTHKNQQMNRQITIAAIGIAALASGLSTWAGTANEAKFSQFSYVGNDDFYAEHPLPTEHHFYNPILPGWYSDPSICTNGEGDYYLALSTFVYYPGVPIFHSRDLVNWEQVGNALTRESQCKNFVGQHVSGGIFAPDIQYNPANKTYYMITTNVGAGNFFVKTTDPAGEWSEPIYLPEVQGIDPAFFFDVDGRAYIVNNDDAFGKPEYDGHRTVRVVEFDTENDKCIGERRIVVNKGVRPADKPIWCEGPHIYNINGTYYLMTAEGGTSVGHSEVIYKGASPFGPFIPWDQNPMLTQRTLSPDRENPVTCAGHADLVQAPDGEWWGVFLACRPWANGAENVGRETYLLPVKWTQDGWPYMTLPDEEVPLIVYKHDATRGDNYRGGNWDWCDNFEGSTLNPEWLTLRGDAKDLYTVDKKKLTLKCGAKSASEKDVPAYVCRRLCHHKFAADVNMEFNPADANDRAGMLLFKDETHQYFLGKGKIDGKDCVYAARVGANGEEILGKVECKNKKVSLKVDSDGPQLSFLFSTDGGKVWKPVATGADAAFTSTAQAGGFTGTVIGLYATSASQKFTAQN